jgi:hypothetical protein
MFPDAPLYLLPQQLGLGDIANRGPLHTAGGQRPFIQDPQQLYNAVNFWRLIANGADFSKLKGAPSHNVEDHRKEPNVP